MPILISLFSVWLAFPSISSAVIHKPKIDVWLEVTPNDGLVEFKFCHEDQCRVLGGRSFPQLVINEITAVDTYRKELDLVHQRTVQWMMGTLAAICAPAFGAELAPFLIWPFVNVTTSSNASWMLPLFGASGIASGWLFLSAHNRVSKLRQSISDGQILNQLKQGVPEHRSQFLKFIEQLESTLKGIAKHDCRGQLRASK